MARDLEGGDELRQPQMLNIDAQVFDAASITPKVADRNAALLKLCQSEFEKQQKWFHIGAEEYRKRRDAGETAFPKPVLLPHAKIMEIPSRDEGRSIGLRCFVPQGKLTGIYLHIHGGGWVLSNAASQDDYLSRLTEASGMVSASIEYRLAPEHPSPAAQNDCFDVAHYLLSPASMSLFPLSTQVRKKIVIGGESAGAHLAALTIIALRQRHRQNVAGGIFNYGVYDLSLTPSASSSTVPLVLCREDMIEYLKAYVPEACHSRKALQDPEHSPLYADLAGLCPALFSCGTADCLLDDTILMALKYTMAGNTTEMKLLPGAPHGFATMMNEQSQELLEAMTAFLRALSPVS